MVCPDVGVSKSDDTQGSTHAGGSFNWLVTISVTNGPASATVEDTVPANFAIGSVSANDASIDCSNVSQTVTCTLTNTPTGTYTVTIPVTAPAASVDGACANHENDVVVTSGGGTNANNDSASDTVGVICPDVGVFKSNDAGGSITAGGSFTWTVTVAVTDGPASGTVQDTVPAGFAIGNFSSNEATIDCGAAGAGRDVYADQHAEWQLRRVDPGDRAQRQPEYELHAVQQHRHDHRWRWHQQRQRLGQRPDDGRLPRPGGALHRQVG